MSEQPYYQPGNYWGRVTEQALGQAKTGTTQLVLRFEVLGRIDPSNPDGDLLPCARQLRTYYRAITDKTIEYVADDLQLLGYSKSSLRFLDPGVDGFHDFCGKEFAFYCKHEPDRENVLRERWGLARTLKPLDVKPADGKELRKLDALFGRHAKPVAAQQPAQKSVAEPAAVDAAALPADDETPF